MDWNYYFPRLAGSATLISSVVFAWTAEVHKQMPKYPRAFLFAYAMLNIWSALVHWLMKPFGGLQRVAKADIGPPSKARNLLVALQADEGQHKFWAAIINFYVAIYASKYAFKMCLLRLCQSIADHITHTYYKTARFEGKSIVSKAPGRFRSIPMISLPAIPLMYGLLNGDLPNLF